MWIKSYKCSNCKYSFPLGPGFLGFNPCPRVLLCKDCKAKVKVSFVYKYTYYFNYCWKVLFFLSFFIAVPISFTMDGPFSVKLFFGIVTSLFIGVFVGFLASYFIALPVAIIDNIVNAFLSKKDK